MQYFVFGAAGYIGAHLYYRLKSDGRNVIGTSRNTADDDELLYFDIQSSDVDGLLEKANKREEKAAIICIASPIIDRCLENYSEAYDINVVKTKQLIGKLTERGFHVIYFSSDNVFDGENGNYTERSRTNPINKYGSMKAEMEQYILRDVPDACILRIPKIVSPQMNRKNIFTEWLNQAKTGYIRCIKGNFLSFLCIEDIYQACLTVIEKGMHGLYNIAGDESFSRAELAEKFCKKLGITDVEIQECDVQEFHFKDKRPLDLSMSNMKFKSETGHQFMSMDEAIQEFVRQHRAVV